MVAIANAYEAGLVSASMRRHGCMAKNSVQVVTTRASDSPVALVVKTKCKNSQIGRVTAKSSPKVRKVVHWQHLYRGRQRLPSRRAALAAFPAMP